MNTLYDSSKSAQSCGCDAGVPHLCERHQKDADDVQAHITKACTKIDDFVERAKRKPATAVERLRRYVPRLSSDPAERKKYPVATGVLDYFPDAILAIAYVSYMGNEQHNPGQPLHWAREKSTDQTDTMMRHYFERGTRDKDGCLHSAKQAWRTLANLQLEIEAEYAREGEA